MKSLFIKSFKPLFVSQSAFSTALLSRVGKSCRYLNSSSTAEEPISQPLTPFGRAIEDDYANIRSKYGLEHLKQFEESADRSFKRRPKTPLSWLMACLALMKFG